MSWVLSISGAAVAKAGANCNSMFKQASGAALMDRWSDQSEATLSTITRRDWVGLSGTTLTNFKGILDDIVSDMIAMKIISYDMSGYTSRAEATTMLDVLKDNITKNIEVLRDEKNKEGVMF